MATMENTLDKECISEKELDYWLMKNTNLMEKLSVEEPSCWLESDTPGSGS